MYYYNVLAGSQYFHGDKPLTYSSEDPISVGSVVQIPLRNQRVTGIIIGEAIKPKFTTKLVERILSSVSLPKSSIKLLQWISTYYPSSQGVLVSLFAPSFLLNTPKKPKLESDEVTQTLSKIPPLTPQQSKVINQISKLPEEASVLLHGETGSGKTRVYLELAKKQIEKGKNVIVLTPEIGLTAQLVKDFENTLNGHVIVSHSNLTEAKRRKIWLRTLTTDKPIVVIGPRSVLFLPLNNIGLIVIDEAHEQAYKQEQAPRYYALRVAAKLAKLHESFVVYGTATPNISEYYTMKAKSNLVISMTGLATSNTADKGKVSLVSIKDRTKFTKNKYLSDEMITSINNSLNINEQSLVFLNRRGTARIVACNNCGWQSTCPNCDLPLTYHGDKHQMICHTCGYNTHAISACPKCKSTDIIYKSIGTKAIVEELKKLFPKATIQRFDTDNRKADSLATNYSEIAAGKVDILVGTQLLGKGLDLPKLSTVGVVSADTSLNFPDFSAEEKTYQMITQIVGRIGRGHRKGNAIIQTINPENKIIKYAINNDWSSFYKNQIEERNKFGFPPFYHLLKLSYSAKSSRKAETNAEELVESLSGAIKIIGPSPSFFEKRDGLYSWQIVVKAKDRTELLKIINQLPSGWNYDIDPVNLL